VNFPAKPQRTHLTNYTGKATYRPSPGHTVIGFGQVGRNSQPLGPAGSLLTVTRHQPVGGLDERRCRGVDRQGRMERQLRRNSFLELRAGQFGANRSERPTDAPRFEDVVTLVVRAATATGRQLPASQVWDRSAIPGTAGPGHTT